MNKFSFLLPPVFVFCIASCTLNKAKINNDLKKYFDSSHVDGSFTLLNNQSGDITVYNMKLDTQRFSPASTFSIVNVLTGVQTGNITDENMVLKPGSGNKATGNGDKGLTLKQAFLASDAAYFQEIARRTGKNDIKLWVDSIRYGNKDISGPIDSFWLNNHLKISPDEQLGLMSKLYFDQLPFQKYGQQMVRHMMLIEDNTLYKLSYKTSGGGKDDKVGWVVGWIEENKHVYFFVTLVKPIVENSDLKGLGINITKGILKELGFFKGEM